MRPPNECPHETTIASSRNAPLNISKFEKRDAIRTPYKSLHYQPAILQKMKSDPFTSQKNRFGVFTHTHILYIIIL